MEEVFELMLHDFVVTNREEIIRRCRARISTRPAPRATELELEYGVPLFLDELVDTLRLMLRRNPSIGLTATKHGKELLREGFTIAQVVHDYGGICQSITELAVETGAPITTEEFQVLNKCLDDAIADAVTEYNRLRDYAGTERLGRLAHEMRNLLNSAILSLDVLRTGTVGVSGTTGAVLTRSLTGLRVVIDRELAEVRLSAGIQRQEAVVVFDLVEDVEAAATLEANAKKLNFSVTTTVQRDVTVLADRQILGSMVGNLLQNAFKFTVRAGHVWVRAHATGERVLIEVEDQCGGLPPGQAETLFQPFAQGAADRSGLGLGLSICQRGAEACGGEIRVTNRPGVGCIFTVDLPRHIPAASGQ